MPGGETWWPFVLGVLVGAFVGYNIGSEMARQAALAQQPSPFGYQAAANEAVGEGGTVPLPQPYVTYN